MITAVTVAVLVVAAGGNGSPAAPAVAGQPSTTPVAAAAPSAVSQSTDSSMPAGSATATRSPEQVTAVVGESTVVGSSTETSVPAGIPMTTEAPVRTVVKEPEVALDLGSDPSRPDSKEAGQTPAQPALETADGELSTVEVVRILAPSVVQIANESVAIGAFNRPIPAEGVGTGVIIDAAGHILTSSHVIEAARTITVTLSDGERYEARLVGNDPTTDVSIIAIETEGLQPARTLSPSATRWD